MLRAKDTIYQLKKDIDKEAKERSDLLLAQENRLVHKEESLDKKISQFENREALLFKREKNITKMEEELKQKNEEIDNLLAQQRVQLEKIAGITSDDAKKLEDEFRRIQTVKSYLTLRGYSLNVLYSIYEVLPESVMLSEIRFNKGEATLAIKGTASSMTIIYAFVDSLSNKSYFNEVKTRYTTKRKEAEQEVADFELAITLAKVKEES